jgi:PAS domain S-box-containing protein/putative nucleotidyltransferase with HDIG domain
MTDALWWIEHYGRFLEALNSGALVIDRQGTVTRANTRFCEMMRRERSELLGRSLTDFYPDSESRAFVVERRAHFDEPWECEFHLPMPDGSQLPVIVSSRVLGDEPPLNDLRLVTITDLSEHKRAEESLKEQYEIIAKLSNTILEQAVDLKHYSQTLEERVAERTAALHEANLDAIYMLAVASEAKDEDTGRHVRRIRECAAKLARELGFGDREADEIGYSAVLHDVGKMHVPDHVLKKPGPLTPDERKLIEQHTIIGERILSEAPFFARARAIARSHHENWDASGYPDGTAGNAIAIEARIVHLADVFDALTSPRVYKLAWSEEDAAGVIRESRGKMFDPDVVKAFESLFARGAIAGAPRITGFQPVSSSSHQQNTG